MYVWKKPCHETSLWNKKKEWECTLTGRSYCIVQQQLYFESVSRYFRHNKTYKLLSETKLHSHYNPLEGIQNKNIYIRTTKVSWIGPTAKHKRIIIFTTLCLLTHQAPSLFLLSSCIFKRKNKKMKFKRDRDRPNNHTLIYSTHLHSHNTPSLYLHSQSSLTRDHSC